MAPLMRAMALLTLAGGATAPATAEADEQRPQRKVIGKAVASDFGVKLTAERDRLQGEPDTATVRIAAFERKDGRWERMGEPIQVGTRSSWFWQVVTGRRGVRRLRVSRPGGECPDRVALRLQISPSIGPSAKFRFATCEGRFRAVDV
jgi:hypothetical protein